MSDRVRWAVGLALTARAGWIDAFVFLTLESDYPSFMSGNSVQFGADLVRRDLASAAYGGALIGSFVLGAAIGAGATLAWPRWGAAGAALLEAALVGSGSWITIGPGPPEATIILFALAFGLQNHILGPVRGIPVGGTFLTGTLSRFGQAVGQRLLGRDPAGLWRLHLVVWVAFAAGAAAGAGAERLWRPWMLAVPSAVFLAVALLLAILAARTPAPDPTGDVPR